MEKECANRAELEAPERPVVLILAARRSRTRFDVIKNMLGR